MKSILKQFSKFIGVGLIAFAIDWSTMTFLTEVAGFHYLISTSIGFTVSIIFNYLASMRYVFTSKGTMTRKKEFAVFVSLAIVGLGLNNIIMFLLVGTVGIDYRIAKFGATACVALYNFFSRKYFLDAGMSTPATINEE